MTQLYDRLNKTAHRLITKYGYNKAEFYRQLEPLQGWKNDFETVTEIVDIIVLPSPKYSRETYRLQNAKDMVDNNYIAYMADNGFTPTVNDTFKAGETIYAIQSVVAIKPNGKDIVYKMELK